MEPNAERSPQSRPPDDDIIDLASELIRIRTEPENTAALHTALDLCRNRITSGKVEIFECNGSRSLLAWNTPTRPERFRIILNGHLDIIPGKPEQYEPVVRGDRLYGVGATDMKAAVATIIAVFNQMADQVDYPLGLQLVTDEELGGFNGTGHQVDQGIRTEFVIAAESTGFDIVNRAKGVLWATITARGVTAHGAYPWRGENAVQKMVRFLTALEREFPVPMQQELCTTVNVSSIRSENEAFNKIPDQCAVQLDIREMPGEPRKALDRLRRILPDDFELKIVAHEPALFVPDTNLFLHELGAAAAEIRGTPSKLYCAQGSSDARHYTRVGDAGVEFGPLGGGIGGDEEWVDLPSLSTFKRILLRFLERQRRPGGAS